MEAQLAEKKPSPTPDWGKAIQYQNFAPSLAEVQRLTGDN